MKLFDLDGTLTDSNRLWMDIDLEFFKQHHLTLTDDYTEYVAHTNYEKAAVYTKEHYGLSESPEEIMRIWFDMAEDAYRNHIPLKPGVSEYLKLLSSHGEKAGIVTSCMPKLCRAVLRKNNILQYFSSITTISEMPETDKSSPEIWLLAARKMNVSPEKCTVFEDSYKAASGARRAGMYVIGVYDTFFDSDWEKLQQVSHKQIRSFTDLLASDL